MKYFLITSLSVFLFSHTASAGLWDVLNGFGVRPPLFAQESKQSGGFEKPKTVEEATEVYEKCIRHYIDNYFFTEDAESQCDFILEDLAEEDRDRIMAEAREKYPPKLQDEKDTASDESKEGPSGGVSDFYDEGLKSVIAFDGEGELVEVPVENLEDALIFLKDKHIELVHESEAYNLVTFVAILYGAYKIAKLFNPAGAATAVLMGSSAHASTDYCDLYQSEDYIDSYFKNLTLEQQITEARSCHLLATSILATAAELEKKP